MVPPTAPRPSDGRRRWPFSTVMTRVPNTLPIRVHLPAACTYMAALHPLSAATVHEGASFAFSSIPTLPDRPNENWVLFLSPLFLR